MISRDSEITFLRKLVRTAEGRRKTFKDPEIVESLPEVSKPILPDVWKGSNAVVFKLNRLRGGGSFALRCFLKDVPSDWERRYQILLEFLSRQGTGQRISKYFVGFKYLNEERKSDDNKSRLPVIKMEWVDGQTLWEHLLNPGNGSKITTSELAQKWYHLATDLKNAGVAHGDLQSANIMVRKKDSNIVLVDYDGVYHPGRESLRPLRPSERGHENYNHPKRTVDLYGKDMDNFAAYVIYLALRIIARHPTFAENDLVDRDHLVFTKEDFEQLRNAPAVEQIPIVKDILKQDPGWQPAIDRLREMCKKEDPSTCPPLGEAVKGIPILAPASLGGPTVRPTPARRVAAHRNTSAPPAAQTAQPSRGTPVAPAPTKPSLRPTQRPGAIGAPATVGGSNRRKSVTVAAPPPSPAQLARSGTLATLGCIFALLGLFTGGILAIPGLILSIVGLRNSPPGRKRAIIGVAASLIGIAILLVMLALLIAGA